jgi:predicted transposase YbfD/YdcC
MPARWPLKVTKYFQAVDDPRRDHGKLHELLDVLILSLCGVLCGAQSWVDVADYARTKKDWFETFLDLPNGIPSHDTFDRLFRLLDPEQLLPALQRWLDDLAADVRLQKHDQIAIDGKTLRGSVDRVTGQAPWMMVSAWAAEHGLVLGQVAARGEVGELAAVGPLLDLLDLEGRVVTLDALGCQKEIAAKIRGNKGDYVASLKDNHPTLAQAVRQRFVEGLQNDFVGQKHQRHDDHELEHGRLVRRCCDVLYDVDDLPEIDQWSGVQAIALMHTEQVRGINTKKPKKHNGQRLFLCSLALPARKMAQLIRQHWHIENQLHWQLDLHLGEDLSRIRRDHGPANLAALRRLAITLGKRIDPKISQRRKMKIAGWSNDYLVQLLTGLSTPPPLNKKNHKPRKLGEK